ncbi:MAG: response regulator [Candidatus Wallbacteria bacterium]|nr:response regulator [Candidatus Wallbacteria bacterium]
MSPLTRKRLLLIEDEESIYFLFKDLLEKDFDVFWARDGAEGLTALYSDPPDIVILDLMLQEIDGLQVCRVIKSDERISGIPVMVITARPDEGSRFQCLNAGVDSYILKPFDVREVASQIRGLTGHGSEGRTFRGEFCDRNQVFLHIIRQLDRKLFQLSEINRINQALLGEATLEQTLELIVSSIRQVCGFTQAAVYRLADGRLILSAVSGQVKETGTTEFPRFLPLDRLSPIGMSPNSIRGIDPPICGMAVQPLLRAGVPMGMLYFKAQENSLGWWREILEIMADCAALAIWKSGLYNDLREKARGLEEANESLKNMKMELIIKEKFASMGQLSSTLAHEINNPLASISGFAQIVAGDVPDSEKQKFCRKIIQETERINSLTEKLLHFSDTHVAQIDTDLKEVLEEAVSLLSTNPIMRKVKMRFNGTEEIGAVRVDRNELLQVFYNLLLNAAQAMRGNGEIVCHFGSEGSAVWVEISDSGPGVSSEVRKRIFEPFFTTKGKSGAGLGLPISMMLAERNGGVLSLKEIAEGSRGAVFRIDFRRKGAR